jgi:branched-chain amino acid transport system permease protein
MDITRFTSKRFLVPGIISLVILIALATLPLYLSGYPVVMLTSILMYIIITVSWVMFSGPTGYMSLATAAFFGVGIYAAAILGFDLPLPVVIAIAGLVSFIVALGVGALTLRLRGIYFAIFTFGLVELIKHLVLFFEATITHTRGRFVVVVDYNVVFYYMLAIFVVLMVTAYFIRRSKYGLALQSIGKDEIAAAHRGINVTMVKVITFAISAFFMGAAGAVMATKWTYIEPYMAFSPLISFMPVLMAIFGGMGQIYGPVIGAAIFAYLEEFLLTKFPYFYMLIFGFVLVAAILYLPNGLVGVIPRLIRRWRKGGAARQNAST